MSYAPELSSYIAMASAWVLVFVYCCRKSFAGFPAAGRGAFIMVVPTLGDAVTVRDNGWQPQCTCLDPKLCWLCPWPRHTMSFWLVLKCFITGTGCLSRPQLISAPADFTIREFMLCSDLTSSFLKPWLSLSLERVLTLQPQIGL